MIPTPLNSLADPAAFPKSCQGLQDLSCFPQGALSTAQGLGGMRRWYFKPCSSKSTKARVKELKNKLQEICDSHWPGEPDCVPVTVQWGAPDEKVNVLGDVQDISEELPLFDQYLIVAQYQLLHISDPWPFTCKPKHPRGTVLTLQVRGGGEMLQIDPTAFSSGIGRGMTACFTGVEQAPNETFNSRIRIPLTEYHITCDRLTDEQLCNIMRAERSWRMREGTVNGDCPGADYAPFDHPLFLREEEGTLMFDTWALDQTFVPDTENCRRWRLTCVLKCRQIPNAKGPYPDDCNKAQYAVGWNHEYKRDNSPKSPFGWRFIMMQDYNKMEMGYTPHGTCPKGWVPRYPYYRFEDLFCADYDSGGCEDDDTFTCPGVDCREPQDGSSGGNTGSSGGGSTSGMEQRLTELYYDAKSSASRAAQRHNELP
jgi:hypothetical protein